MFENLADPALTTLQFAPGTQYHYSDLAVALLALAEPVLAGSVKNNPIPLLHPPRLLQAWERMLGSIVLRPLGMNLTHPFSPALDPPLLPRGYSSDSSGISTGLNHNNSWPSFIGAGGIVSTPNDMMLYLEYNLGLLHNSLNSLLTVLHTPSTTVETPISERLGLGWFIGTLKGSNIQVISKNGGVPAFTSEIEFAPSSTTGVMVLSNSGTGAEKIVDVETIAYQVLQIINGLPVTAPSASGDQP
jgi:D-alanyl-D-alanine-carboxypeptidase/D-alanyl-D-alanine-endopeptidase